MGEGARRIRTKQARTRTADDVGHENPAEGEASPDWLLPPAGDDRHGVLLVPVRRILAICAAVLLVVVAVYVTLGRSVASPLDLSSQPYQPPDLSSHAPSPAATHRAHSSGRKQVTSPSHAAAAPAPSAAGRSTRSETSETDRWVQEHGLPLQSGARTAAAQATEAAASGDSAGVAEGCDQMAEIALDARQSPPPGDAQVQGTWSRAVSMADTASATCAEAVATGSQPQLKIAADEAREAARLAGAAVDDVRAG